MFGLIFPPFIMNLNYKPLTEYRLVMMTEIEHQQIEDEVREEKELLRKTKSNQSNQVELQELQDKESKQQQQQQQQQQQREERCESFRCWWFI